MARKSRLTVQKEIIRTEFNKFNTFFSAEDLYGKVKKKNSDIGIATIYRFLKELKGKHDVHSFLCDRSTVYSRQKDSHCKFVCEKCGKTEHFEIDTINAIKNKVAGKICHFQIEVSGICEKCIE